MVIKNSFMRTKQFFCLAVRQSFRNLVEQYMELKVKEEKASKIETNQIVLPGYMNINPRNKAIVLHSSLVHYSPNTYPVVTRMDDIAIMAVLMSYTKYIFKWITNCLLGMFGNSLK